MPILIDVSEALIPFRHEAAEALDEVNTLKEINLAVGAQLQAVIDYLDGLDNGDYTEEDLIAVTQMGGYVPPTGPPNPLDDLHGELFDAIAQGILVHRHPDQIPICKFSLHNNLLRVWCYDDWN